MTLAFTCQRATLLALIDRVSRIVEKRTTIPILNHVLIAAKGDGKLTITGTDLSVLVTVTTELFELIRPGTTAVEADLLLASLKRSVEGKVKLDATDREVVMVAGRGRTRIPIQSVSDYPEIPIRPATHEFEMEADDLDAIEAKCSFAMSADISRHFLMGVCLRVDQDHIYATATDGIVLSRLAFERPEGASGMPSIIVPDRMIRNLSLVTKGGTGPIKVAVSDEYIRFERPELLVQSKLVEGGYPDVERIVPKNATMEARLPVAELSGAVERMMLYAPEKDREAAFLFTDGKLCLKAKSGRGDTDDELEIDTAFDLRIGFNTKRLLGLLGTLAGDWAWFKMTDQSIGTIVLDSGDDRRLCLIMPFAVAA